MINSESLLNMGDLSLNNGESPLNNCECLQCIRAWQCMLSFLPQCAPKAS